MAGQDKRVIEQQATSEVFADDWFLKDSVTEGTTKISSENLKAFINEDIDLSAEAVSYDNTESGLEADNVQDAIDEVLETAGKVDDVKVDGESVVDENKVANIDLSALKIVRDIPNTPTAIATFSDGADLPMPSLKVAIEPQQDLHGYDAPWVGGAGKNKLNLDFTNDTDSFSGLTFSHTDSTFKLKGTVSGQNYKIFNLTLPPNIDLNTDYTLSATVTGTVERCLVSVYFKNGNTDTENIRVEISDTTPKNTKQFSAQFDNATFVIEGLQSGDYFDCEVKIQLEKGSSATAWQPYSNICPIIGWSEVNVSVSGVNLLDYDKWKNSPITRGTAVWEYNGVTITATGNDAYVSPTNSKTFVKEGQTIILKWEESTNKSGTIYIFPNGSTEGMATVNNQTDKNLTYTVPSGVTFITFRFGVNNSGETITYKNIRLEFGNQAPTTYEPYAGTTYNIQFKDGDNPLTVYGGSLDVVSGVLTVDRAMVDIGSLDWKWESFRNGYFWT